MDIIQKTHPSPARAGPVAGKLDGLANKPGFQAVLTQHFTILDRIKYRAGVPIYLTFFPGLSNFSDAMGVAYSRRI
jgi:hypothetical protein